MLVKMKNKLKVVVDNGFKIFGVYWCSLVREVVHFRKPLVGGMHNQ